MYEKKSYLPFLLLIPSLTVIIVLYLFPLLRSVYRSFLDKHGELTFSNFEKVYRLYSIDIIFSVAVSVASLILVALLSIALASYLRFESANRFSRWLGALYRIPLFIPFLVVGQLMRTFLAPHGLMNNILAYGHLVNLETPPNFINWKGLIISFVWKQFPFATLLVLGGFRSIDDSYIESAQDLGAGRLKITYQILTPMALPTIIVAMILTFVSTVSALTVPLMMGGSKPVMMTVDMAFRITYFGDYGVANALGVISYVIVIVISIYYLKRVVETET
jgi:putative spermidine/putrescine transport system permease protein